MSKWNPNPQNHPRKGSSIRVQPIKDPRDIKTLKGMLWKSPRDYALFVLGINSNLRASDLLRLKAGQVKGLKLNGRGVATVPIKEKKTGKLRLLLLNKPCLEAIERLLESRRYRDEQPLFSGRDPDKPLLVPTLSQLVKSWCGRINLHGNYASHSLRKTFGYQKRRQGKDLTTLVKSFGHSSARETLTYLCIEETEVEELFAGAI